jgi:glycosyltransferase involved in cell wall biosynthesis
MTAPPTVSVVLIFFNDERFLPEAIESVFAQTYTDWELILSDDGSTDGSTEIARGWGARHPGRVHYIEHEGHANLGPSAARNHGIRQARGSYVAFLDSDDVWEPNKLAEQVLLMDANPDVGLLVGASTYWWSWAGLEAPQPDRLRHVGAAQDRIHRPPSLLHVLYPLGRGVAPCPSSWVVRRDALGRIGGFEESIRTMYEDQAFLMKAYHEVDVWVSSRQWDRYRRHPDAVTMTTGREEYHAARREFLSWYEGYLQARDVQDPAIWRAVRRAWWPYRHPWLATCRSFVGRLRARGRRLLSSSVLRWP